MVFCYKLITESPRRSGSVSPRKSSPIGRLPVLPSSISELVSTLNYEDYDSSSVLDLVPEREWRLLAALARKREKDKEREKLADAFRQMWHREKIASDIVTAETSDQYKRYLQKKREQDNLWQEYKRMERVSQQQVKRGLLMDTIRHKEQRSADQLAWSYDKKATEIVTKSLQGEVRSYMAADRRTKQGQAEDCRKREELVDDLRKVDAARRRRSNKLRDASQRVAITNALNSWESTLLRQEVTAMDAAKRAQHAASAAMTDARSMRLARARISRQDRARRIAAFTEQLRNAVRRG